jgi:hypothetical protein
MKRPPDYAKHISSSMVASNLYPPPSLLWHAKALPTPTDSNIPRSLLTGSFASKPCLTKPSLACQRLLWSAKALPTPTDSNIPRSLLAGSFASKPCLNDRTPPSHASTIQRRQCLCPSTTSAAAAVFLSPRISGGNPQCLCPEVWTQISARRFAKCNHGSRMNCANYTHAFLHAFSIMRHDLIKTTNILYK